MALPKLVGQGISSAAGAIGKSVKTGAKAFGALAASQMEPEVLAGIAGIKTLAGKFKGAGESSGDMSELQQSVEEVPSATSEPIVQTLEQIPPQTSEPIVEKIEELKEAKESEANLEPVIEKLDELTPMVEKIDQLAEQNETDLFNSNFILDNINQGIEKISSLFESMVQRKAKERSDSLEEKREASRSRRTTKSQSRLSLPTRDRTGGGGGFFDTLKGLFSGPLMSLLAGGAGGGIIGIITAALPAIGGILAAVLPIALPLLLTAATAAAIFAFLNSELADEIRDEISKALFDPEEELREINESIAESNRILKESQEEAKAHYDSLSDKDKKAVDDVRAAIAAELPATTGPERDELRVQTAIASGSDAAMTDQMIKIQGQDNANIKRNKKAYVDDSMMGSVKRGFQTFLAFTGAGIALDAMSMTYNAIVGNDVMQGTNIEAALGVVGVGPDAAKLGESSLTTPTGQVSPLASSADVGEQEIRIRELEEAKREAKENASQTTIDQRNQSTTTTIIAEPRSGPVFGGSERNSGMN